jgi:hypothetical protein
MSLAGDSRVTAAGLLATAALGVAAGLPVCVPLPAARGSGADVRMSKRGYSSVPRSALRTRRVLRGLSTLQSSHLRPQKRPHIQRSIQPGR